MEFGLEIILNKDKSGDVLSNVCNMLLKIIFNSGHG